MFSTPPFSVPGVKSRCAPFLWQDKRKPEKFTLTFILGDTDFGFKNVFLELLGSQISRFPDRAWARLGPGLGWARPGWIWLDLGWAWAGLGLCLLDVLNMFSPLMKKPPIFSVPWFLEASFVFLASSKQASQLYFSESLLTDKHRTPKAFLT